MTHHDRPHAAKAAEAAEQFEALMIGFMLKSGREAGSSSWLGGGDDAAGGSAIGYAEEQLARALSSKGGLGLAKMITAGLEDQSRLYSKELASPSDGTDATDPGPNP
jgi:Rod binding domain-containing protein